MSLTPRIFFPVDSKEAASNLRCPRLVLTPNCMLFVEDESMKLPGDNKEN